jgi:flagella basal body P-ring formation protein FlgA
VETNAPANTTIQKHRLEEEELRGLLTAALTQGAPVADGEWELRLTRAWTPITVPAEPLRAEIIEPAPSRMTSSCILRFELRAGGVVVGSWQVPVQTKLWREVLVAPNLIKRGQVLSESLFTRERRDVLRMRDPLCDLPADAAGYELSETVPAGMVLTARSLRLRPVVFRGQMADAIVRNGAMVISLRIEVLEEGAPGQIVRVRNPLSRREFRGKVQDERTIAALL